MQKYKDMSDAQKIVVKWAAAVIFLIIMGILFFDEAQATGKNHTVNNYKETNNYYETSTITSGVSSSELAEGLSLAMSMNHPFDYNTLKCQGSITGAVYDDESAVSFGIAKRFEKMDALWHIEAGQNGSNEAFVGGVVFRF